jgi:hypothetical protein
MDTGRKLMVQVDLNVLLDLFTDDPQWAAASVRRADWGIGRISGERF